MFLRRLLVKNSFCRNPILNTNISNHYSNTDITTSIMVRFKRKVCFVEVKIINSFY